MSRQSGMRDAFPIVCALGDRLQREKHGWRDAKALIVLVAGAGYWPAAADLADALGVAVDEQVRIFVEVYGRRPGPGELCTPENPCGRWRPPNNGRPRR